MVEPTYLFTSQRITQMEIPVIYKWREKSERPDEHDVINPNNIIECAEWCRHFATNRLSNDVGLPLERMVVGSYQVGYLFDQIKMPDGEAKTHYLEENIASVLIHLIASFEMTDREFFKLVPAVLMYTWSEQMIIASGGHCCVETYLEGKSKLEVAEKILYHISENLFKYQRWMLYHHMDRKKRWDEKEFCRCLWSIVDLCLTLCYICECDLVMGFALAMEKLQDSEIKRH